MWPTSEHSCSPSDPRAAGQDGRTGRSRFRKRRIPPLDRPGSHKDRMGYRQAPSQQNASHSRGQINHAGGVRRRQAHAPRCRRRTCIFSCPFFELYVERLSIRTIVSIVRGLPALDRLPLSSLPGVNRAAASRATIKTTKAPNASGPCSWRCGRLHEIRVAHSGVKVDGVAVLQLLTGLSLILDFVVNVRRRLDAVGHVAPSPLSLTITREHPEDK